MPTHTYRTYEQDTIARGNAFLNKFTKNNLFAKAMSSLTLFSVGSIAKVFMNMYHKTTVYNKEEFNELIYKSEKDKQPVITVMNHVSTLDDPLVWGASLPCSTLARPSRMRWTLGAEDVCFKTEGERQFFSYGQTIPVKRFGAGPDQPAVDAAISLLNQGKWVHAYPEGFVHQPLEPFAGTFRYFRWGISRLILESPKPALVIPIYGKGLEKVYPENMKSSILGHGEFRTPIDIAFGAPLDSARLSDSRGEWRDALQGSKNGEINGQIKSIRSRVADYIQQGVVKLKMKYFPSEINFDFDPRLRDASFWSNQTVVSVKGLTAAEKRKKAGVV